MSYATSDCDAANGRNYAGKGMYLRQRQVINAFAELRGTNMFKDSTVKVGDTLQDQLKSLKKQFHAITEAIHGELRDLIMLMLNLDGLIESGDGKTAVVAYTAHGSKEKVQQATHQVVAEWAAGWRIGVDIDMSTDAASMAIPDVYYEAEETDESEGDGPSDEAFRDFVARKADAGLFTV